MLVVFPTLVKTTFIERPNRFILLVKREDTGEQIEAHLPDPGRLKELLVEQATIWVEYVDKSSRKTSWTAILCETKEGNLVSLQTTIANKLAETAIREKRIPSLRKWSIEKRECKVGSSRFDFLLKNDQGKKRLLEVKSVTLSRTGEGFFPDAPTARGARHVQELTKLTEQGRYEAAILFVAQRNDIRSVAVEAIIDPAFAQSIMEANQANVQIVAVSTNLSKDKIAIGQEIPFLI
ncbi:MULTISPECIES: DNA/RNA nuclease SfsA [Shouchella]|uniref:Sugar fermentation stimulation protein homolog n=1 Tax=Shouchella hunanensis TaxID=766894 RepID=A0ABY7W296_9BACI|nr:MULTISPECIES: DNA/RNA nuclease SfsA [Shouchella]WDF02808.1 DNA/RNA nuclease SfsA [Shouchella hunanensis]GAF22302.1 sugar/maltose fermentation stimulation protein homolog [Bacillus sp. JCM 19047]